MITRLTGRPISSVLLCMTLCSGTAAFAQDATTTKTTVKMADGGDQYPDLWEFDPFGGIQTFGRVNRGLDNKLSNGGVFGGRAAYNPYKYLGLELWMDYSIANNTFGQSNGPIPAGLPGAGSPAPPYGFGARNWTFGFNPVWNIRPRGSRIQPYLTAGIDGIQFTPTSKAESNASQPNNIAIYGAQGLNDNLQVGFNFGGGVKWHFSDHFGLRFDVRALLNRNPTYDLPGGPDGGGVYIPGRSHLDGLQSTLGLVFYAGESKCQPMPAAPPAPAPLATPTISGGDGGASGTFCAGKPVTLHANIAESADRKLAYAWTVNGQAQSSTTPDLTITPTVGSTSVQLTVTDTAPPPPPLERPKKFPLRCWVQPAAAAPVAPVTATATVTVSVSAPTITSVSASPNTLTACGPDGAKTSNLSGVAQSSACGGNLTYKWTVSEGSVSNDSSPNATFDVASLTFEQSAQAQSKSVVATLTVTDESGKTATQTTPITVNCAPQFVRLDDAIFAKNNSRVNNCAKRLLIDDAASRMANGDYDIILVGHRDTDEEVKLAGGKGRKGHRAAGDLVEERLLNTAAILSGGTGTCGKVDVSRIKIDAEGTDQTSDPRPGQCGTSNTQERKGSETSEADKNRRVEIYLVPHGSTILPPAVKNPRPVPEPAVKALGCPH